LYIVDVLYKGIVPIAGRHKKLDSIHDSGFQTLYKYILCLG